MSWATNSVGDAIRQLGDVVERRCAGHQLPSEIELIRTPVALMFVRGDRAAPGRTLADQVVQSFGYWNVVSAHYLDLVFFGWYKEGDTVGFQPITGQRAEDSSHLGEAGMFVDCCREIERISKWRYSGETDVLLVDFELPRTESSQLRHPGRFSFKNCMYLPVEALVEEKRYRSLDALVSDLVNNAREVYEASPLQATVFDISDRIGWTRGRKTTWDRLKEMFLRDWSKVYDELRPFAVCDLTV